MGDIIYGSAIHIREQAKIDAARITQKSGNELRGAQTALQQFSASLNNKRTMDAAGKNIGTIKENLARSLDGASTGAFETRIQAAEHAGAATVMAASAGIAGSSVDAYNETAQLALDRAGEAAARAGNSQNIGESQQIGNTMEAAVAGQDNNVYRANIDYTQYVDHHAMGMFEKLATLGVAAAATYFGGPQAGQAVIGMSEAGQAAANGDFQGASSSLMGSFRNAAGAAKSYQETGGSYWGAAKQKEDASTIVFTRPTYGSTNIH